MQNQNKFDHIKLGKTLRYFAYPPAALPDMIGWEDALPEICLEKIRESLDRAEELKQMALDRARIIKDETKKNSLEEFFLKTFFAYEFAEYFVIRKWLRYWSEMWRMASNKSLPRLSSRMSYCHDDIERARRVPLEGLYEGKSRRVGARQVGLCPFHEEKTPSFYIFPDNHFHCYGCGAHGDSIEFVMRQKELSFPEGMKYLL